MPMSFDLDEIEPAEREPALRELLQQNPVPIDVSTIPVDELHVSTTADYFGRLFMVSCNGRGARVHRGAHRVDEDHQRTMMLSVVTSGTSVFHTMTPSPTPAAVTSFRIARRSPTAPPSTTWPNTPSWSTTTP